MTEHEVLNPTSIQTAFVRATADEYEEHASEHPNLAFQIDYYVPAWGTRPGIGPTRVLVVTGARWRVQALEAFLNAITRLDGPDAE